MANDSDTLPRLTSTEYKEIFSYFLERCHGCENAYECMSKCLSAVILPEQKDLRVLIIGPGVGEIELKLLSSHKIAHLTAVEPSLEMAVELETNLRASSTFINEWNIYRTKVESFLEDKAKNDGPFDVILMIHSIYYVFPRDDVICQLRSLLRPHTSRLILVLSGGCYVEFIRSYIPNSEHIFNADGLDRDLHDVNIPFERHRNDVTFDLTNIKGNEKLEWVIASFFLGVNVANRGKNFVTQVITDLLNLGQPTKDGGLDLVHHEDVFIIKSTD